MILLNVREFFNGMQLCSFFILPLFIMWFIVYAILKIKKCNKSMFFYRVHRNTGIFMMVAFLIPMLGCVISNFCPGEQKTFRTYEHFVGTEPARSCSLAAVLPEDDMEIRYYCYYEPLQIGKKVGVNYRFEKIEGAQDFANERLLIWENEYSKNEHIIYLCDEDGLSLAEVCEERLRENLAELSEYPLEEYKVLLYYENNYGPDRRWILYNEKQQEVIEIVVDYAGW